MVLRLFQFKLMKTLAWKGIIAVEVVEIDGVRLRIKKEPRPFTPSPAGLPGEGGLSRKHQLVPHVVLFALHHVTTGDMNSIDVPSILKIMFFVGEEQGSPWAPQSTEVLEREKGRPQTYLDKLNRQKKK